VFDEGSSKMVVAPFEIDYQIESERVARTIPSPAIQRPVRRRRKYVRSVRL